MSVLKTVRGGDTDVSVTIRIIDSGDGTPETAVEHNTAGIDLWYRREGAAKVSITEAALAALTTAHTDGGIEHIGDGYYRLDLPDAAVAAGVPSVSVGGTVTGMIVIGGQVLIDPPVGEIESLATQAKADVNAEVDTGLSDYDAVVPADLPTNFGSMGIESDGHVHADLKEWKGTAPASLADTDKVQASIQHDALALATAADVAGITQAQRVRVIVPSALERPDAGSTTYRVWIYAYDELHQAEDLDSVPTVAVENNVGTDRSSGLGTVTKPGATTGVYYVDYTVANSHAIEGLAFRVTATEGGTATEYAAATLVVDTTAVDFTAADRAKLDELHDNRITSGRAAALDNLDAPISGVPTAAETRAEMDANSTQLAKLGTPATDVSADIAAVKSVVDAISTLLTTVDGKVDAADAVVDAIKVITDALGATAAARLALSCGQMIPFTVDTATNTHTPTTTEFQADDITEATADHYNGRRIVWLTGALAGQATSISDYEAVGGIGQFTVVALTEPPADDDTGLIV